MNQYKVNLENCLIEAIKHNYLKLVKYLVKEGANVSYHDSYPLILASKLGNVEMLKYLVKERNL